VSEGKTDHFEFCTVCCNKDGPLDNFQFPYRNKRERLPSVPDSVLEQARTFLHVSLQKLKVGSQHHTENILKFTYIRMCHGSIFLVMGKFGANSVTNIFFRM
jgi:hypothetical protein